jgi:hypothetical protein
MAAGGPRRPGGSRPNWVLRNLGVAEDQAGMSSPRHLMQIDEVTAGGLDT